MGWLWFCFRLGCDGLPRSDGIAGSDAGGHGSVRSSHVLGIEAHAGVWPVALGALPRQVMSTALGNTFILLLAASAAGLGLGVMASRLLAQIVCEANAAGSGGVCGCNADDDRPRVDCDVDSGASGDGN